MKKLIIDQAHSDIEFKVKHLMISTVKGSFQTFSGGVSEDGDVNVSMNVNSINTGSIERDNIEWMVKYNATPINSVKNIVDYKLLNENFPSLSVIEYGKI